MFEQDVVVNHPQFDLVCDKLIVFLKKQAEEEDSALDKAIATGKRVTVRKTGADGEVQIGQARKVTFEGKSGDVILEDWPQVQTDTRLIQAKSQDTIIILNQDGKMKINGRVSPNSSCQRRRACPMPLRAILRITDPNLMAKRG